MLKKNAAFRGAKPHSLTAILPTFWKYLQFPNFKLKCRLQVTRHCITEGLTMKNSCHMISAYLVEVSDNLCETNKNTNVCIRIYIHTHTHAVTNTHTNTQRGS